MKDNKEKKTKRDVCNKNLKILIIVPYANLRRSCSQTAAHMLSEQNRICTGQTALNMAAYLLLLLRTHLRFLFLVHTVIH
jgi:hypothetical protein